jgi:integrase
LRDILGLLLGREGKRMLSLRNKSNAELFTLWRSELAFRYRSERALKEAGRVLSHFEQFLGGFPPSAELAKGFLSQYLTRKTSTLARYSGIIAGLMKWYGEPLDIQIKRPKPLPQMVDSSDTDRIEAAMRDRKTHKKLAQRDILLVETARFTGLRRAELSALKIGDIDFGNQLLVVRMGKGQRDRSVPLVASLACKLEAFCRGKRPEESIFGLKPVSISGKIRDWAEKAGCPQVHAHSLRHQFATTLARRGVGARAIQQLLGHEDLGTSQRYIDLVASDLREAVRALEEPPQPQQKPVEDYRHSWERPRPIPPEIEELIAKAEVLPKGHPRLSSY